METRTAEADPIMFDVTALRLPDDQNSVLARRIRGILDHRDNPQRDDVAEFQNYVSSPTS